MLAFSLRKFSWGLLVMLAGGLIWADNLGYIEISFRFGRDWPIILIAIGLMFVWDALFGRHWWGNRFAGRGRQRADLGSILEDLETGKISAADAAKRIGK